MNQLSKKESNKLLKRKRIIDSASLLFSQMSYHEVMMEDVARMIDVAKGTVYNYFTSKEELYFSIMSTRLENLLNSLNDKIKSEHNSIDSLRLFIHQVYMFMMTHKNFQTSHEKLQNKTLTACRGSIQSEMPLS